MARRRRAAPADAQTAAAALLAGGVGGGYPTEAARLDWADKALIYQLHRKGQTQPKIATIVGCHQSTVSRVLRLFQDSRPEALALLQGSALQLAATVAETTDPGVALKALGKLDVVRDDHYHGAGDGRVVIVIGTPQHPLRLPDLTHATAGPHALPLAATPDDDVH